MLAGGCTYHKILGLKKKKNKKKKKKKKKSSTYISSVTCALEFAIPQSDDEAILMNPE
jgi:hypothetical protein